MSDRPDECLCDVPPFRGHRSGGRPVTADAMDRRVHVVRSRRSTWVVYADGNWISEYPTRPEALVVAEQVSLALVDDELSPSWESAEIASIAAEAQQ